MLSNKQHTLLSHFIVVSFLGAQLPTSVGCIVFDEVESLNVWITISSLASKDPGHKSNVQFRQIELNWINAPLNDNGDYIALYLDSQPDANTIPVSIHRPSTTSGKQLVPDYYLPVIDFYNETFYAGQDGASHADALTPSASSWSPRERRQRGDITLANNLQLSRQFSGDDRWNTYKSYVASDVVPARQSRRIGDSSHEPVAHQEWPTNFKQEQSVGIAPEQAHSSPLAEECIGYCVAYLSQKRIIAKSCLKTQPTWMRDSQLGSRSPTSIALAGTHNSGTYQKQRLGSHKIDKSVLQLINKYQLNQEESVFNQLVYGIRYLDLRVGFSKVKHRQEELWIYHDIFRTDNSLEEILRQIRRFLELTKDEIVIVDFHRFTVGFQNEDPQTELAHHAKVLDLLFNIVGDYIVPSYLGQNAPLNEYVSLNKRLFVGYAGRTRLLNLQANEEGGRAAESNPFQLGAHLYQFAATTQPVRDIDADKQEDGPAGVGRPVAQTSYFAYSPTKAEDSHNRPEETQEEMLDRRIGARVYNRLKSLKLVSHSFSKRSISDAYKDTTKKHNRSLSSAFGKLTSNVYKSAKQAEHLAASPQNRSSKISAQSAPLVVGHSVLAPQSFNAKLSLLFNPVHHVWPNTDKEDTLKQFMEQSTCRKYFGELNSVMAELTPTVFGVISDKYDGIRRLSAATNRMVGDLVRSKFLHCINLIATDYFLGNDLIRLTIHANKMRIHHRNTDLDSLQSECKSFRQIKPLLEKSKLLESNSIQQSSSTSSLASSSTSSGPPYQAEGFSDLITSFIKRIFSR